LTVRVAEGAQDAELGTLSRAFNRMTSQLDGQRQELIAANRQQDERRRFTETVLAGVTAGVIGLDAEGRVNLPNRSALLLLGVEPERIFGRALAEVVPEMAELLALARRRPGRLADGQITLVRGDRAQTLYVRIAAEVAPGGEVPGYVVTFDDMTILLAAQRKAAWSDVARRIAHEIKNPLTPIQLAAERLKRKYLSEITTDRETFEQCTDTIVRQVADIGRLIDEFASFARMPAPIRRDTDLDRLCREAVFLQRAARPEIAYTVEIDKSAARLYCDGGLLAQALTNLLKNAAEAIDARRQSSGEAAALPGRIGVFAGVAEGSTRVLVEDNGEGLPPADRHRLTEPYVTTRAKGTGLGLAIVKKIMEDHGGDLKIENRETGGARVTLTFPHEVAEERREGATLASRAELIGAARATGTGAAHGA
jgi:two-component system nitrogen regulation sensor histidine kinase NtrY